MKHPFRRHCWHVVGANWNDQFARNPGTQIHAVCTLGCPKRKVLYFPGANLTLAVARVGFPRKTWR